MIVSVGHALWHPYNFCISDTLGWQCLKISAGTSLLEHRSFNVEKLRFTFPLSQTLSASICVPACLSLSLFAAPLYLPLSPLSVSSDRIDYCQVRIKTVLRFDILKIMIYILIYYTFFGFDHIAYFLSLGLAPR